MYASSSCPGVSVWIFKSHAEFLQLEHLERCFQSGHRCRFTRPVHISRVNTYIKRTIHIKYMHFQTTLTPVTHTYTLPMISHRRLLNDSFNVHSSMSTEFTPAQTNRAEHWGGWGGGLLASICEWGVNMQWLAKSTLYKKIHSDLIIIIMANYDPSCGLVTCGNRFK